METLHKALFRDHSLKVVKVATLQKSHRSSLLDRGFKETDEVVFCEACNGPRSNWDLDSLRQHLTGIKHTELLARLMEKKGTKVKKTHPEDDADKNDDEAEDEDEEEKEVRVTTGLFSKTEKNKMFAHAALYGGSTSGQARHFRNAAAKLYGDPSISKGALVEMHIDKIFQEDMEVVLEDLQRSGTIQLLFDGAVVLGNHILAVSGGSTGKWIDTFVNRTTGVQEHFVQSGSCGHVAEVSQGFNETDDVGFKKKKKDDVGFMSITIRTRFEKMVNAMKVNYRPSTQSLLANLQEMWQNHLNFPQIQAGRYVHPEMVRTFMLAKIISERSSKALRDLHFERTTGREKFYIHISLTNRSSCPILVLLLKPGSRRFSSADATCSCTTVK